MNKLFYGLMAAVATTVVAFLIDPILGFGTGFAMAIGSPTLISGVRDRANLATNREDIDFEQGISLLDPNENPATAIVMQLNRGTTANIQKSWFEDELVPEVDTVATTATTGATEVVVDNPKRFAAGDLVRHDLTNEIMLVVSISSSTLTVDRDYGYISGGATGYPDTVASTLTEDDYLSIVGNALEAGHPLPSIRSTKEVEYKNWCQDQRTPIGLTEVLKASKTVEGEDDWAYQLRKAGIMHQRKLEWQTIWGKPTAGDKGVYNATTGNTAPGTSGGINYYIEQYAPSDNKLDETEITLDEFLDWLEYVFAYGSASKFMFCAPRFRTAIERWGILKLNTTVRDTVLGMNVVRWQSSHGELNLVTHKMLKRNQSTDYFYNFIIDMPELKYYSFSNIGSTRVRELDPYKATGETIMKAEYQTISTMKFGQAAKHARLRFKTFATS